MLELLILHGIRVCKVLHFLYAYCIKLCLDFKVGHTFCCIVVLLTFAQLSELICEGEKEKSS